jgi:hypothetical protein
LFSRGPLLGLTSTIGNFLFIVGVIDIIVGEGRGFIVGEEMLVS